MLRLVACIHASLIISLTAVDRPICKRMECQEYKVLERNQEYEIRLYPDELRAFTMNSADKVGRGCNRCQRNWERLSLYRHGANEKSQKFPATLPVLYTAEPNGDQINWDNWRMSMMIPQDLGLDAPEPNSDRVGIADRGPCVAFV